MSITVGIDLGTTNSCVAVPATADIPNREKLIEDGKLRQVGGALVVLDEFGSATVPSVVWVDGDGTAVVGRMAKQKAKLPGQPPPAMFFKRAMGTDDRLIAGHATLTPLESSTHVLRYLKNLAEDALGAPVDRAIVTVPAFFEARARNETTQAGREAGLEVMETLLEPVAAALTYARSRALSEPRTFLVYDLGGGTFDASVVSWDPDIGFENRRFDGDRFLGGYEFDKLIVQWAARQLPKHDLRFDIEDPNDVALFARLLSFAETVKQELTEDHVATIIVTSGEDRSGIPLNINLPIRRATFEEFIEPDIRSTIEKCDRALDAAWVGVANSSGANQTPLDEIVMVGGSSRIPLVARLLREHYQIEPVMIDPDLCVAVGAAMKAASAAIRSSHLLLDRPAQVTALPTIDLSGQVIADNLDGVVVWLVSGDGTKRAETVNPEGRFLFQDVPLREDTENVFTVEVVARDAKIDAQRLVVEHSTDSPVEVEADGDVLTKDIAVELVDGQLVIGPAGTKLPYRKAFPLETANQGVLLRVRLIEGSVPIGKVEVRDLPRELPVGTAVQVEAEFQRNWTIRARASVPAAGPHAVGIAEIDIPQIVLPSWDQLRERYEEVRAGWEDKRMVANPVDLMRLGPGLDALLTEIEPLLNERVDRAKTHHKLQEADTRLRQIPLSRKKELQPPWEEFEARLDELDRLADALAEHDEQKSRPHKNGIPGLRSAGQKAFEAQNKIDWHTANEAVRRQILSIKEKLPGGQESRRTLTNPEVQQRLLYDLNDLIKSVRETDERTGGKYHKEANELISELQAIVTELRLIDANGWDASRELKLVHNNKILPMQKSVDRWQEKVRMPGSDGVISVRDGKA
jgi:actin-like ATPase involved in cell morphogenesis